MTYRLSPETLRVLAQLDVMERVRECSLCGKRGHEPYCVHSPAMQRKLRRWRGER